MYGSRPGVARWRTRAFVHCSYRNQVTTVAHAHYGGVHGRVLLVIDRQLVGAQVRDERLDAVTDVLSFEPSVNWIVSLPEALANMR